MLPFPAGPPLPSSPPPPQHARPCFPLKHFPFVTCLLIGKINLRFPPLPTPRVLPLSGGYYLFVFKHLFLSLALFSSCTSYYLLLGLCFIMYPYVTSAHQSFGCPPCPLYGFFLEGSVPLSLVFPFHYLPLVCFSSLLISPITRLFLRVRTTLLVCLPSFSQNHLFGSPSSAFPPRAQGSGFLVYTYMFVPS